MQPEDSMASVEQEPLVVAIPNGFPLGFPGDIPIRIELRRPPRSVTEATSMAASYVEMIRASGQFPDVDAASLDELQDAIAKHLIKLWMARKIRRGASGGFSSKSPGFLKILRKLGRKYAGRDDG